MKAENKEVVGYLSGVVETLEVIFKKKRDLSGFSAVRHHPLNSIKKSYPPSQLLFSKEITKRMMLERRI